MKIETEEDMGEFCIGVKGPFSIAVKSPEDPLERIRWEKQNAEQKLENRLSLSSHLQQGIADINHGNGVVIVTETPLLYPSSKFFEYGLGHLTGATTGVLLNAYDPDNKTFLFHLRGRDISAPFGFQATAAGMSVYGEHPFVTAVNRELGEEEGSSSLVSVCGRKAIDILPFMKFAGQESVPQPLFSFGFFYNSGKRPAISYPFLSNLDQVTEYEQHIKEGLSNGTIRKQEAYHFNVPSKAVDTLVEGIFDRDRTQTGKNGGFYGPITQSHDNFVKYLKDSKQLD